MTYEFVARLFTGTKHQIWETCIAHTLCFIKIQEIKVTYSFCRTPSFIQENCSLTNVYVQCILNNLYSFNSHACDSSEQEKMLLKHPLQNECFIIPCLQHLTKSCDKSLEWTCKRRLIFLMFCWTTLLDHEDKHHFHDFVRSGFGCLWKTSYQ